MAVNLLETTCPFCEEAGQTSDVFMGSLTQSWPDENGVSTVTTGFACSMGHSWKNVNRGGTITIEQEHQGAKPKHGSVAVDVKRPPTRPSGHNSCVE